MEQRMETGELDYRGIRDRIASLKERFPFIKLDVIGKSVMGKEIPSLQIGKAGEYVLYAGVFRGTERLTGILLLKFAEDLCLAIQNDTELAGLNARSSMFGHGLIIVPVVNPDGYDITLKGAAGCGYSAARIHRLCSGEYRSWEANARGVDLTHNFSTGWNTLQELEKKNGIYGPCPRKYGGHKPESEPETVALAELCRRVKIRHALSFQSQGEVIYWSFGDRTPPKSRKMAEIMAACSGYAIEEPAGTPPHCGFKDWFIDEFGRPGFQIEIGRGEYALSAGSLPGSYEKLKELMMVSAFM